MRLARANLATKADIADLVEEKDFDNKLKNINKKVTSKKTKHVKAEKKLTDLTKAVAQISEKGYDFSLGRMYFTGDSDYQNVLVFGLMLSSLILDSDQNNHLKKLNHLILTLNLSCLI